VQTPTLVLAVALCVVALTAVPSPAAAGPDGAALFARRCTVCHTVGEGDLDGPDLKGVGARHSRQWLAAWVSSSRQVIASGDAAAVSLFAKYNQQRMPDQKLSGEEMSALLDFLVGAPDAAGIRRDRRVEKASSADIESGRLLFFGRRRAVSGAVACGACHRAGSGTAGGTLGRDLTHAFSRYHDRPLAALLERGCSPRGGIAAPQELTDDEAYVIRAFLRDTDMKPAQRVPSVLRAGVSNMRHTSR